MSSELTVRDYTTGQVLDVKQADDVELAEWAANLYEHRAQLSEAERLVSDEMLERLDRSAKWTVRVGDPKGAYQYEIKAPSPSAGTEVFLADKLEQALRALLDSGRITPMAASLACRRSITLTLGVPWDADPAELAEKVCGALTVEVGGIEVEVLSASSSVSPVAAGIRALRKVVGDALDGALDPNVTPPARRVKVTRKERLR